MVAVAERCREADARCRAASSDCGCTNVGLDAFSNASGVRTLLRGIGVKPAAEAELARAVRRAAGRSSRDHTTRDLERGWRASELRTLGARLDALRADSGLGCLLRRLQARLAGGEARGCGGAANAEGDGAPFAVEPRHGWWSSREPIRIHRRGTAAAASPAACAAACRAALPPCLFFNFARAKGQCVLLASRADFHAAGAQFLTAAA